MFIKRNLSYSGEKVSLSLEAPGLSAPAQLANVFRGSSGLNYRDGEKVRIKASLFFSAAFLFIGRCQNKSASLGTVLKLTRKWPDFREAGWQREEGEKHSSGPALSLPLP